MKNKIKLKKYLLLMVVLTFVFTIIMGIVKIKEYQDYTYNFNKSIVSLVKLIKDKYPEVSDKEIMTILNAEEIDDNIIKSYGIDIEKESIVLQNDKYFKIFWITDLIIFVIALGSLIVIFLKYNKSKDKDIKNIIKYLEQINKKNYELNIDTISEDELSILKNELYKVTVMLKESAQNSLDDKINLKRSLEDISHQLKTPLTSILIILDNLLEDTNMEKPLQEDFLRDIKREVVNINFLVQNLLKLSKLEANSIKFVKKEVKVEELIKEAMANVSSLGDLKNVTIVLEGNKNIKITCDYKWEIEALTNLLKNAIEYSKEGQKVLVKIEQNVVYTQIIIQDFGKGIKEKDLKHIFERFYKGENASSESVGIGLALAKMIIEEDNGAISVSSDNQGTKFIIKYFN